LSGTVEVARRKIREFETLGEPCVIFARCFGVLVSLKSLQLENPKRLDRLVLWGAIPLWLYWKMFMRDVADSQSTAFEKKSKLDGSFFPSLEPIEVLLPTVQHRTIITCGGEDKYSRPAFHSYLKQLCIGNAQVEFREPVVGAAHELTSECPLEMFKSYMDTLFCA
jgi:hypothetical protein